MDEQVRAYRGLCEQLARMFVGRNGAELDDLVQEGLIDVWRALEREVTPSARIVQLRMLKYVQWLGRQHPVDYEDMLPLDPLIGTPDEPSA
jgi:DNA-directed RNA polymerase specialized sigma24 family protein